MGRSIPTIHVRASRKLLFLGAAIASFLAYELTEVTSVLVLDLEIGVFFWIAVYPVVAEAREGSIDWLNPRHLFAIYYFIQLGLYTLHLQAVGEARVPWLALDSVEMVAYYARATALAVLGLSLFQLGAETRALKAREAPSTTQEWSHSQVSILLFALCLGGIVAMTVVLSAIGGLAGYSVNFVQLRYTGVGVGGYVIFFATSLFSLAAILLFVVRTQRGRQPRALHIVAIFVLSTLPLLAAGFRGPVIPVLFMFVAVWNYRVHRIGTRTAIVLGAALLAVLGVYGFLRADFEGGGGAPVSASVLARVAQATLFRSNGSEVLVSVLQQAEEGERETKWYAPFYETLTMLIPRSWWPGKPMPQSLFFGYEVMYDFFMLREGVVVEGGSGGVSPTTIGYFYWAWGLPGSLCALFVLGLLCRALYDFGLRSIWHDSRFLFYITLACGYPMCAEAPQDVMNGAVIKFGVILPIVALLNGNSRRRERRVTAAQPARNFSVCSSLLRKESLGQG